MPRTRLYEWVRCIQDNLQNKGMIEEGVIHEEGMMKKGLID